MGHWKILSEAEEAPPGRPLSHLVFSLLVDALTNCILKAQEDSFFRDLTVNKNSEVIPVQQYADDTLLLLEADLSMVKKPTKKCYYSLRQPRGYR